MDPKLEKFISRFNLPRDEFSAPTPFIDAFGFSTKKERLQNGLRFVSIYKFYIKDDLTSHSIQPKSIKAVVEYAEIKENGDIVLSPTSIPRKSNWPMGIWSDDEFFYDTNSEKFFFNKTEVEANNILKRMDDAHLRPTRFAGWPFRIKVLSFYKIYIPFLSFDFAVLRLILYICFGYKTSKSIWRMKSIGNSSNNEKVIEEEPFALKKIKIFEYEASAWAVVIYSLIHLLVYSWWYYKWRGTNRFDLASSIFENSFLTISYVIPSLALYEWGTRKMLLSIIEKVGDLSQRAAFKQFKVDL